jgi:hypothetical protein
LTRIGTDREEGPVNRIHDVGGMYGFGRIDPDGDHEDSEPFHADWEARVCGVHLALVRAGVYTVDEFRHAVERMDPAEYLSSSYYERWLAGIVSLLEDRGLVSAKELLAHEHS